MTLLPDDRKAIIEYRIERSYLALREAEYVAKGDYWNLAANRLYYAAFYMCEALLLANQLAASTHAGVSRMISLHFIKTEIIAKEDGRLLGKLFRMRQTGDYEDLTDWSENEVKPYIDKAKYLIDKIENLTKSQ